jgi:exodeoxyribonuclease-5
MVTLSAEQERCVKAALSWYHGRTKPWFFISGPAGSGKSTLMRCIAEAIEGLVLFGSFTGKSALVMRRKGCEGAQTLHRLVYAPSGNVSKQRIQEQLQNEKNAERRKELEETLKRAVDGQPLFRLNPESALRDADLLVVDEVSMVGKDLARDILSFNVPVLVLGDKNQLPPVASEGFFTGGKPDFELTEIHRQAKDNPVLQLADMARRGLPIQPGDYGTSKVVRDFDEDEMLYQVDQLLVGRNKTRMATNAKFRRLYGRQGDFPEVGERLICLRNNHKLGLLNGGQWKVESCRETHSALNLELSSIDDDLSVACRAHKGYFTGTPPEGFLVSDYESFDYSYAITVHKSQGSEWPHVAVLDQSREFGQFAPNWLYTAITRASDRVTIKI